MRLAHFICGAALFAAAHQAEAALVVYSSYQGSQQGVTVRDAALVQSNAFGTGINATGIAAGTANDVYLSVGDQLIRYRNTGAFLGNFTFGDPTLEYTDVAVGHGNLYATYRGSQQGITVRNPDTFSQSLFINTGVNAEGITAGLSNDVYIAADDQIIRYQNDGTLLNTMTFGDPTIDYFDLVVADGVLYTTYGGSQQGVTIRDLVTLSQTSFFATPFTPIGIAAGFDGTIYLNDGSNSIYHYSNTGALLNTMAFPDQAISYSSLASVIIVPEPATLSLAGLGLLALVRRRRLA